MYRLLGLAAATATLATSAFSAFAQEAESDRVNTIIVYGEDPCPASTDDVINVCARMAESERYRIPPNLRESSDPANQAWVNRVLAFEAVGRSGPLSCSPSGAGGELGCTAQFIEAAYAEREQGSEVRFSQLINAAREERLARIDEEAAETQARVEAAEREYLDRIRREQEAAEASGQANPPPATARTVDPNRLTQPPE